MEVGSILIELNQVVNNFNNDKNRLYNRNILKLVRRTLFKIFSLNFNISNFMLSHIHIIESLFYEDINLQYLLHIFNKIINLSFYE